MHIQTIITELITDQLFRVDWQCLIIDWTEKSFGNVKSTVDCDIVSGMKKKKRGIYAEEEKKNDDNFDNEDQHDTQNQEEHQEDYQEEKKSDTFDESHEITERADIECSFQIIMTEVWYFLYIIYILFMHYLYIISIYFIH